MGNGLIIKNIPKALNTLGFQFDINSKQLSNGEIKAINTSDPDGLINYFLYFQTSYYKSLHSKKYERGWLNRVNELHPKKQENEKEYFHIISSNGISY